jgi:hypothetical protein
LSSLYLFPQFPAFLFALQAYTRKDSSVLASFAFHVILGRKIAVLVFRLLNKSTRIALPLLSKDWIFTAENLDVCDNSAI